MLAMVNWCQRCLVGNVVPTLHVSMITVWHSCDEFPRMPREYNEDEDPAARRRKKKRWGTWINPPALLLSLFCTHSGYNEWNYFLNLCVLLYLYVWIVWVITDIWWKCHINSIFRNTFTETHVTCSLLIAPAVFTRLWWLYSLLIKRHLTFSHFRLAAMLILRVNRTNPAVTITPPPPPPPPINRHLISIMILFWFMCYLTY